MPQLLTHLAAVKFFIKEFRMWIYFYSVRSGGGGHGYLGERGEAPTPLGNPGCVMDFNNRSGPAPNRYSGS